MYVCVRGSEKQQIGFRRWMRFVDRYEFEFNSHAYMMYLFIEQEQQEEEQQQLKRHW